MPLSNLQTFVEELVSGLQQNPENVFMSLMGQDKKALVLYRFAKQMFNIDDIVQRELGKLTARSPEQWYQLEDLILGVIDGDEDALNVARQFFKGVVKL